MPSTALKEPKSIQFVQRKLNQAHTHELRLAQWTMKLTRQWVVAESKLCKIDWYSKSAGSHTRAVAGCRKLPLHLQGLTEAVLPSPGHVDVDGEADTRLGSLEKGEADARIEFKKCTNLKK